MASQVPLSFQRKKQRILEALNVPESEYSDLSPKGSIDVQIRNLINEINSIPGLVTTSSCSGRVSVFIQGRKRTGKNRTADDEVDIEKETSEAVEKSLRGRWLFVSHDPIDLNLGNAENWHTALGLSSQKPGNTIEKNAGSSLIHFKFEPMILHLLAASLEDANAVLAAANQAGFRESGALNLAPSEDGSVSPMVGVRSMGLGFDSVIGIQDQDGCNIFVDDKYLEFLAKVTNERFQANLERMNRFRTNLKHAFGRVPTEIKEDSEVRRQRKKAKGLARQIEEQRKRLENDSSTKNDESFSEGILDLENSSA